MGPTPTMVANALNAMVHVLGLTPADRVLVLTDRGSAAVGEAFREAAVSHGCRTGLAMLPEAKRPLASVPADLARRAGEATVVVNAIVARNDEIPFRLAWLQLLANTGRVRCGHSPGITTAMLESGPLSVDYGAMIATAERLIAALAGADTVRLTGPGGTDLTLSVAGRAFHHDCRATPAQGSNLPCGEIYAAPVETRGDGVLVADGAIGAIGRVAAPVRLTVAGGRVVEVTCADADLAAEVRRLLATDDEASVVGELGVGINPGARIVGCMLEDEKALRTAHVAFGCNDDFGGVNHSRTHLDFLFHQPTIEARFPDGSRRVVAGPEGWRV